MIVAYLVNQYPQPSHSFIRREIRALEAQGAMVKRFTVRRWPFQLVDPGDVQERDATQAVLEEPPQAIARAALTALARNPRQFAKAVALAVRVGRGSERGLLVHGAYFAEACMLLRWFREQGVSHVHAHFGTNSTTVAMLCHELGGPPYSFTAHGPEEYEKAGLLKLDEKLKRAEFAVAISSFGRSQLFRYTDVADWPKVHVVRCGVDDSFLEAGAEPPRDTVQFVTVGRLVPQKGHHILLEAAAKLAERGVDFRVTVVGDGPMRRETERAIKERGLEGRVVIAGWQTSAEVRQHMLNARAIVMPSFAEGLPVVIMEALALGRPVISTAIAGIPELVSHGTCGWVVPAGDADALASAMIDALNTPTERLAEMGRAGAARVAERHHAGTEARRLHDLFLANSASSSRGPSVAKSRRYCLITPCRDEAKFARVTLDSVVAQTEKPALWVIVDDGSSDETPQILKEYADKYPFIRVIRRENRGFRKVGGGVVDAFYAGYNAIDPRDFDYVCKLDLDLELPAGYFAELMTRMEQDTRLGTCSGKPYFFDDNGKLVSERCGDENSVGMTKFYRTECFEQIGGFVREVMWDGVDGHRCRMKGWIAASWDDPGLRFIHLRPMGTSHKSWWTGRVRHGRGQYFMGTHPLYMLASAVYRLHHPPVVVGSLAMLTGYFGALIKRAPRYDDLEFRKFLRSYQWKSLVFGKTVVTSELNRKQQQVWSAAAPG